ncbi:MAG: TetR/AcrR family transcriptional regulator [Polyangiaceae bacterium]
MRRILDACVSLMETGEEPTMRSAAKAAGIAERTVYRHFDSLETLVTAVRDHCAARITVPLPETAADLDRYVKALFDAFEANRELVVTLVGLAPRRQDFEQSRAENLRAMRQLIDGSFPDAPRVARQAAADTLRTLASGSAWVYLRVSCGLPNSRVIQSTRWLMSTAFTGLDGSVPDRVSEPAD